MIFTPGSKVVLLRTTPGHRSAVIDEVASVEGERIALKTHPQVYDLNGREIGADDPSFTSEIRPLDDA